MAMLKSGRNKLSLMIRAELCRIDFRCVIAGAVIVLACGVLSALAAGSTVAYYELVKPRFAPPRFVFPIVWTILYLLIGGAAGAVACVKERALRWRAWRMRSSVVAVGSAPFRAVAISAGE